MPRNRSAENEEALKEMPEDESGSPAPGDDDYKPQESGESEASAMETDEDEDKEVSSKKKRKAKTGVNCAAGGGKKHAGSTEVGKRKHSDAMGGEPAPAAAAKRVRATSCKTTAPTTSSALVANWQDTIAEKPGRGRSSTPGSDIPDVAVPSSRSSSRFSMALSVPASSIYSDNTNSNGLGLGQEDEAQVNQLEQEADTYLFPPPDAPPNITRINDVRAALHYRECACSEVLEQPSNDRVVAPLTKILPPVAPVASKKPTASGALDSTTQSVAGKDRKRKNAGGKTKAATISDIPSILQKPFTKRFIPLARQFVGTLDPWQEVQFSEYEVIYRVAFGDALAAQYPLVEHDKCHKLIQTKVSDWRAKFMASSIEAFKETTTDNPDPELAELFANVENIAEYAKYLLRDGKAGVPFYQKEWNGGTMKIGRLRGDLIVGSLAAHLADLQALPQDERTGELPRGALGMATIMALHTLTHYQSGVWAPPLGCAGWFSSDNYSDTIVFFDGKQKNDKKLSRILKVIDSLTAEEWSAIVEDARAVMVRRQTAPGKRTKAGKGGKATVDAQNQAQQADDEDSDCMLVADA
ncbi:hypothetical protein C8T65DRAFT_699648 [Cerioporus squamosus]|nr:hypothetical protein C8T65DRAFT_699648 [Cerioporus squamosus]